MTDFAKYIRYRTQELDEERKRVIQDAAQALTGNRIMQFRQRESVILILLDELRHMSDWLEAGEPDYVPPLTEEEIRVWRQARDRGILVPEEILEQL